MSHTLTEKQRAILEYIRSEILSKGYPPSVREIGAAVGLKSTSSVHSHLSTLEENGYIRRDSTKSRTIEIIDEEFCPNRREMANIPLIGTVTAGEPILAQEHIDEYFPIPTEYLPNSEVFMLRVQGNSMVNAGIFDGDSVIVEKCSYAENGEVVAALINDSATIKRFYKEDGHYRLQPENDTMDPILCDHVEILGKVIGLFRMNRNM